MTSSIFDIHYSIGAYELNELMLMDNYEMVKFKIIYYNQLILMNY